MLGRGAEAQEGVRAGEDEAMSGPEEEDEAEEARQATPARDLGAPTKAQYDRHMIAHMPYRALCPWCVAGRGRSSQHRRAKEHEAGAITVMAMDCCYMTEMSTPVLCLKSPRQALSRHTR